MWIQFLDISSSVVILFAISVETNFIPALVIFSSVRFMNAASDDLTSKRLVKFPSPPCETLRNDQIIDNRY
jgi:hypothetical protein